MNRTWIGPATLLTLAFGFFFTACDENDEQPPNLPDTSGAAMWAYLQQENYQQNWRLWPGKGELYEGTEPHGMLLTTYLNEAAFEALMNEAGEMPSGAIIVKENYTPGGTLDAVTTMYKVEGYNPDHNDWFWVKQSPTGVVDVEGRVEGCPNCHQAQAANDYIYTGALQ
jgi:hypothetical protein